MTDPHLTDEQLSSHVDEGSGTGVDTAASTRAHLVGCARCRQRLAVLGAVRARLRTPVPPVDPDVRAASISAVLRRAREEPQDPNAGAAGPAAEPIPIPRRRPQVLVGVAAAVVVLGALAAIPLTFSGHATSARSSATSATASTALSNGAQAGSHNRTQATSPTGASASAAVTVPNLGVMTSLAGVRTRVAAALAASYSSSAAAPATTGPLSAPTPSTIATPTQFERCLSSATAGAGPTRAVRFLGEGTFKTTPALVYVFGPSAAVSPTGNAARSAVVVTARDGCRILGTTYL